MSDPKQLWLLAGGNGAGKSTFYRLALAPRGIKLVNADLIAKSIDAEKPEAVSYEAAGVAEKIREALLFQGITFCFETVFSHPSKIDFVAKAKSLGYQVIVVYIHLCAPALNEARVQQRISEGGHAVPPEKIYSRIPRTLQNIAAALPIADEARILDNSFRDDPLRTVAIVKSGRTVWRIDPLPQWARELLRNCPEIG